MCFQGRASALPRRLKRAGGHLPVMPLHSQREQRAATGVEHKC